MPDEPLETVDVRNNRESKAGASESHSRVSRGGGDGGAPPRDAPDAGDMPVSEEGGTAAGNPVAGVTISDEDAQDAVKGRTSD
jgi:hypothetical protein